MAAITKLTKKEATALITKLDADTETPIPDRLIWTPAPVDAFPGPGEPTTKATRQEAADMTGITARRAAKRAERAKQNQAVLDRARADRDDDSAFECQACGVRYGRWGGRCGSCGQWNSITTLASLTARLRPAGA